MTPDPTPQSQGTRARKWTIYICEECGEFADEWHDHRSLPYWDKKPTRVVELSAVEELVGELEARAESVSKAGVAHGLRQAVTEVRALLKEDG